MIMYSTQLLLCGCVYVHTYVRTYMYLSVLLSIFDKVLWHTKWLAVAQCYDNTWATLAQSQGSSTIGCWQLKNAY